MNSIKIAYICHFSSPQIRNRLYLKSLRLGNFMRRVAGIEPLRYEDTGMWNEIFIKTFENNDIFDCYVITNFLGLKRKEQRYKNNGVNYVFVQEKEHLLNKIIKRIFYKNFKEDYSPIAKKIYDVVRQVDPDVVVLCGAENVAYAASVLLIREKPIFVILQTLLNSPKRIEMGVGNSYRRGLENAIFKHANFFGTNDLEEAAYIRGKNPNAIILKQTFPSVPPDVVKNAEKEFDFVFFANELTKNKGIEDVIRGVGMVCKLYPIIRLAVIGSCNNDYFKYLTNIISDLGIEGNIVFYGHYPLKNDMLIQVMKARIAVLPGITAPMNSTVRESMFMGIPVVMYETSATKVVNKSTVSILTAEMENIEELGEKMLYAYSHPKEMSQMAINAKAYAEDNFSIRAVKSKLGANISAIDNYNYKNIPIPESLLF